MKKVILLVLILFLINFVSAEISVNQPDSVYNLGDKLEINASIKTTEDANSFFEINLICGGNGRNIYRLPLVLNAGEEKTIETSLILTSELGTGKCNIKAGYNEDIFVSNDFEISNQLYVFITNNDISIDVGENVNIVGRVSKENNKDFKGKIQLSVSNIILKTFETGNNFTLSFSLPDSARSGKYIMLVKAYEEYNNKETNYGEMSTVIKVKQTPKQITIESEDNIIPGQDFSFIIGILDQVKDIIPGELDIRLIDSYGNKVLEKQVLSNITNSIFLENNASLGYWKIIAVGLNLSSEKEFYVEENEKISYGLINNTLIITNIGNNIYNKQIKISIGDYFETRDLDIGVGKQVEFKLNAPNGDYSVLVNDNFVGNSFLTGNAVKISLNKKNTRYYLIFGFLILVFGLFIMNLFRKKNNFEITEKKDSGVINLSSIGIGDAEHTPVLNGRKETASLVTIKIKNFDEAKRTGILDKIKQIIKENKASVYHTDDFIIGIFSSPTTRTFANESLAIRAASGIDIELKEHNSKSRFIIKYGIAVNSGELIVKKDAKFKFTSVGNIISLSKKIASLANEEVLLSESINAKLMSEIKTMRKQVENINVYELKGVAEKGKYDKFLKEFLNRQKKE